MCHSAAARGFSCSSLKEKDGSEATGLQGKRDAGKVAGFLSWWEAHPLSPGGMGERIEKKNNWVEIKTIYYDRKEREKKIIAIMIIIYMHTQNK